MYFRFCGWRHVCSQWALWRRWRTHVAQSDSLGGSTDFTPQHILRLAQQGAASDRGRSVMCSLEVLLHCVAGQQVRSSSPGVVPASWTEYSARLCLSTLDNITRRRWISDYLHDRIWLHRTWQTYSWHAHCQVSYSPCSHSAHQRILQLLCSLDHCNDPASNPADCYNAGRSFSIKFAWLAALADQQQRRRLFLLAADVAVNYCAL